MRIFFNCLGFFLTLVNLFNIYNFFWLFQNDLIFSDAFTAPEFFPNSKQFSAIFLNFFSWYFNYPDFFLPFRILCNLKKNSDTSKYPDFFSFKKPFLVNGVKTNFYINLWIIWIFSRHLYNLPIFHSQFFSNFFDNLPTDFSWSFSKNFHWHLVF